MNGNTWQHFVAPTYVNNLHKDTKVDWSLRTRKFGCFTREELIDNKNIGRSFLKSWKNFLRLNFTTLEGRQFMKSGCPQVEALDRRINFLGWLKDPEDQLCSMSFLLDPLGLGHGNMVREAVAAGIPIVYPKSSNDTPISTIQKLVFAYSERQKRFT